MRFSENFIDEVKYRNDIYDLISTYLTHRVTMFQKNQVVSRFTSTITGNIKES